MLTKYLWRCDWILSTPEDPLKMEGARRTLSRWREPGGLSQDGEARGLSSDGGSQRTLSGWREPWRKRRVPEKEVQQEGLRTPTTAASLQERLQGISLGDYLQPISWASRLFRWWISNAILSCIQPSRFFYAELIKIRSHPDHWWMEAVPGSTGEHSSLVGM